MSTIKISMTSFVDFTLKPDSQKPSLVRSLKYREYTPGTDYWKQLRDAIVSLHQRGRDTQSLENLLKNVDSRKLENYNRAILGYKKFLKKHSLEWFAPPSGYWNESNLAINVNPELGLVVDGVPHLIKLYFKEFTTKADILLNKSRIGASTFLMWESLRDNCPSGTKMSVLNVSKGQLVTADNYNDDQRIALIGSVNSFIFYWNMV